MNTPARVRVGIGGWTYEPWRETFYPEGLPHSQELHFASRQLSAIEVNGTFYSTFKPATFARWRDETPEGFVFALKAHRSATHRRDLGTAREAIDRFVGSGIDELDAKLGPVLWQFMPSKAFVADEMEAFLAQLPPRIGPLPLQHVLEVRHASFDCPAYLELARRYRCVTVYTDSPKYPAIADPQAPFAYLRLMCSQPALPTGYPAAALDEWAAGARAWTRGGQPRDVYVFFINGAKERAPAAARALLQRL